MHPQIDVPAAILPDVCYAAGYIPRLVWLLLRPALRRCRHPGGRPLPRWRLDGNGGGEERKYLPNLIASGPGF